MEHRRYQVQLDSTGAGSLNIDPNNAAMEWDINQISVQTNPLVNGCICALFFNGAYIHHTMFGSQDSAQGNPNTLVAPNDELTVAWTNGPPNGQGTVSIWFEENPSGTTVRPGH